ncbi:hypothetical protein GW17_00042840 [Ensete ventricosum]|nr:hypothetical protein GW17_00042840 [Ensete ventricosum]
MHPLRFPNSGIRAKRKLALPMEEGQLHACCLHAEVVGHSQAPCRGGRPWPGYLQGAAGYTQGPHVRGRPAAAKPPARGGHPRTALPPAGAAVPIEGEGRLPLAGAATDRKGQPPPAQGQRRWRSEGERGL